MKQVSKELVFDVGIWHIDSSVSGLTVEVIGQSSRLQGEKNSREEKQVSAVFWCYELRLTCRTSPKCCAVKGELVRIFFHQSFSGDLEKDALH